MRDLEEIKEEYIGTIINDEKVIDIRKSHGFIHNKETGRIKANPYYDFKLEKSGWIKDVELEGVENV